MSKKHRKRERRAQQPSAQDGGWAPSDALEEDTDQPPVPPMYMTEQFNRVVTRLLNEKDFADVDEANRYLQERLAGRRLDDMMAELEEDPVEVAQAVAYRALDAETPEEALDLARRALALDPNCLDALTVRAMMEARSTAEAIERVRGVIAAVERNWGSAYMAETEGRFWGAIETRPYMRSRLQLAVMLVNEQRLPEAIGECRALLRLNPNDNQGVRDPLLGLLLRVGDTAGAEDLIRQYDEDEGATFMWGRALARFQAAGADGANEALARAIKTNRYVFELLTDRRGLPEDRPSYYAFGDVNEAAHCIELQGMAWSQTPGALDWLLNSKVRLPRKR